MATPFAIVLAWYVVRRRTRGGLLLFSAFLGVLVFAYPLALPIPLLAVIVFVAFERRRRGLPLIRRPGRRSKKQLLWQVPLFLLLILPLQGVLEKTAASTRVLAPGYSLVNWGGDLTHFFPERFFLGLDESSDAIVGVPLIAVGLIFALRLAPRDIRWGLGAIVAFGVFAALFFRPREYGWYFHYKALAFVAPLVVAAAAVGLSKLRWQWLSVISLLVLDRDDPQRRGARDRHDVRPASEEPARAQAGRRAAARRRVGPARRAGRRADAVDGQRALRPAAVLPAPAA